MRGKEGLAGRITEGHELRCDLLNPLNDCLRRRNSTAEQPGRASRLAEPEIRRRDEADDVQVRHQLLQLVTPFDNQNK